MITAKQILIVSEEYFKSEKIHNQDIPVYRNPTTDDFKEMIKDSPVKMGMTARIIIDRKAKAVYVWNAYLATHENIYLLLGLNWTYRNNPEILYGEAPVVGNKILANERAKIDIFSPITSYIYQLDEKSINSSSSNYKNYLYVKNWFEHDKDWMFADKYIPGFANELKLLKSMFLDYIGQR